MRKVMIVFFIVVIAIIAGLFYYFKDTTSTLFSFSCGNNTALLFKELHVRAFDIENGFDYYSSFLAYQDDTGEHFIDIYDGSRVFPAYLKVQEYKKFTSVDNEHYLTGDFERTDWNIWVSGASFSLADYKNMEKCISDNLSSFNKKLVVAPYPLQITSISYVPLTLQSFPFIMPSYPKEVYALRDRDLPVFYCPAIPGVPSSKVVIKKTTGEVISDAVVSSISSIDIYRIGFIDANGFFKRFTNEKKNTRPGVDYFVTKILLSCTNTEGKNLYTYYSGL